MSSLAWLGVALLGLCFGLGSLLIRHIFAEEDEVDGQDPGERAAARYGLLSAPALALAIAGASTACAWLTPLDAERPWLHALGALGGAVSAVALGLRALNLLLAKRAR
jgi:hypothetical protein